MVLEGIFDAAKAKDLVASFKKDELNSLDFSNVVDIKFGAMRILLNARRDGWRFNIVNASETVAEKMEDCGLSQFVSVCRKPKPLHLENYKEFGKSFLSSAYNSVDGDSMIKVYGSNVPLWLAFQEKSIARAVFTFGINTPLVGTIYSDGDRTALEFERIEGKLSFSRIISEQPDRLEEMSRRFARMCKKLHETPCDTTIFNDRSSFYKRIILSCDFFPKESIEKALAFLDCVPRKTTCLHGDMQISNVITNGNEDLWIDLSDFGYGNPMLDMGMWYFLSNLNSEERTMNLFHLGCESMKNVWDYFVDEYFGADTKEKKQTIVRMVEPFAALHMLYLISLYGYDESLVPYIQKHLLDR